MQSIFLYAGKYYNSWFSSIGHDGAWNSTFDIDIECNPNAIKNDGQHNQCSYTGPALNDTRKREHLCTEIECIIHFYFNHFMGHKSLDLTAKILSVNKTTFKGWLEKRL